MQVGLSPVPTLIHTRNWAIVNLSEVFHNFQRPHMVEYRIEIVTIHGQPVSDPVNACLVILSYFRRFGLFSGYKINVWKSDCYPVNTLAMLVLQCDIQFKLSPTGFKYLGVKVTRTLKSLYSSNFSPWLIGTKTDLQRWESLPLSFIGRINIRS